MLYQKVEKKDKLKVIKNNRKYVELNHIKKIVVIACKSRWNIVRPPAYIADLKIIVVDKPLVWGVGGSL